MRLQGIVLVVVVVVAGRAWGQDEIGPLPKLPPGVSDLTKLQGRWQVQLPGESKICLWRFTKTHLEVTHAGEETEVIPFSLASEGQKQFLVLRVLGQRWAGQYKFFDDDTIVLRMPRIGQNTSGLDTYVLERVKPQAKEERQITVGRVVIIGNTKTSDEVILKAFKILPGERVTSSMLAEAATRLDRLGIFADDSHVTIRVGERNNDERTTDIVIHVKEATPK